MKVSHYLGLAAFSFTTILSTGAQALPSGSTVTSGTATVSTSGQTMTIRQGSARANIDWNRFDSATGDKINIMQPGRNSVLINRVTGSNASTLAGVLDANGQVVILNEHGITFANGSRTSTAALIASTARAVSLDSKRIGLSDFGAGAIRNEGVIKGINGHVSLVGKNSVVNTGTINADQGRINLIEGKNAKIAFENGVAEIGGNSATVGDAIITNTGLLRARGGEVTLTNKQISGVINLDGVVDVRAVSTETYNTPGSVAVTSLGNINTSASINASGNLDNAGKVVFNSGADLAFKANVDAFQTSGAYNLSKGDVTLIGANVGFDGDIKTKGDIAINSKNTLNINNGDGTLKKDGIYEKDLERMGLTAKSVSLFAKKVTLNNLTDNKLDMSHASLYMGYNDYPGWPIPTTSSTVFSDKQDTIKSLGTIYISSKGENVDIGNLEAKQGITIDANKLTGKVFKTEGKIELFSRGDMTLDTLESGDDMYAGAVGKFKANALKMVGNESVYGSEVYMGVEGAGVDIGTVSMLNMGTLDAPKGIVNNFGVAGISATDSTMYDVNIGKIDLRSDKWNQASLSGKNVDVGTFNTTAIGQHDDVYLYMHAYATESVNLHRGTHTLKGDSMPDVYAVNKDIEAPVVNDATIVNKSEF